MPPIVIAAAISGGAALIGGAMASRSANKAADQQVQATDKGLALQEKIYNQQVAGMQPYATRGLAAFNSLGDLLGLPAGAPPPGSAGAPPLGPYNGQQGPMNMSDPRVQHLAQGGSLIDPEVHGGQSQSSYRSPANGRNPAPPMAAPSGGSFAVQRGGVRMQSPDGEVALIPPDQVEHFAQLGAQRV